MNFSDLILEKIEFFLSFSTMHLVRDKTKLTKNTPIKEQQSLLLRVSFS